jgi:hypothetical protein
MDQNMTSSNDNLANVGVAVSLTQDSCPALPYPRCVFVDASPIRTNIDGYLSWEYFLNVGFRASAAPAYVGVFLVDGPLASLCQRTQGGVLERARGMFSLPPSSARDMGDSGLVEATPVMLQLTRRRELARGGKRGWGWGWEGKKPTRNSYHAEIRPKRVLHNKTSFSDPRFLYPVLASEDVSSTCAQWADAAYRHSTVTPLVEEFSHDNGTNSYYLYLNIGQLGEVVTYTQHDPVEAVALLGIYGTWLGVASHLCARAEARYQAHAPLPSPHTAGYWNLMLAVFGAVSETGLLATASTAALSWAGVCVCGAAAGVWHDDVGHPGAATVAGAALASQTQPGQGPGPGRGGE